MLAHGETVEEIRHLRLDADTAPRDGVRVIAGDVLAVKQDAPGCRLQLAREQLEQRALAGAVGADEAAQLPLGQAEVHTAHRLDAAELDRQPDRLEDRFRHATRRAWAGERVRAADSRARSTPSDGTMPRGTSSTKARKMIPKIRLVLASCCVPSSVARYCMTTQPMIGPTSVPRPPTMTQMMICEVVVRLKTLGLTNAPQLGKRLPARPAIARARVKIR